MRSNLSSTGRNHEQLANNRLMRMGTGEAIRNFLYFTQTSTVQFDVVVNMALSSLTNEGVPLIWFITASLKKL